MNKGLSRFNSYLQFSKASFLAFALISIFAVPVAYREIQNQTLYWKSILVGLISTICLYPFYLIVINKLKEKKITDLLIIKLVTLITLGTLRGWLIYSLTGVFSIPQPTGLVTRLLNSVITTLVWLGFLSVLFEMNNRYRRKHLALSSQLLITKMTAEEERDKSFALIADEILRFQSSLRTSYLKAIESPYSFEVVQSTSNSILEGIESGLKPLTKKIWENSLNSMPKFSMWSLIKISILDFRVSQLLQSSLFLFTATINFGSAFDAVTGLKISIFGTILLSVLEFIRSKTVDKFSKITILINISYLSVIGIVVIYLPISLFISVEFLSVLPFVLILGLFISIILIAFSMLHHAMTARSIILKKIIEEISRNEKVRKNFQSQSSPTDFQLASYLHNSLQSELMAIAYELGEAAKDPSESKMRNVMQKFLSIIDRSLKLDFIEYLDSPRERYLKIVESWGSIVDLTLNVDESLFEDSSRVSLFIQLVQEGLANSVRWGQAKSVSINAHYENGVLRVEILDDGKERKPSGFGIGASWISRVSFTNWNLETNENGSRLSVDF